MIPMGLSSDAFRLADPLSRRWWSISFPLECDTFLSRSIGSFAGAGAAGCPLLAMDEERSLSKATTESLSRLASTGLAIVVMVSGKGYRVNVCAYSANYPNMSRSCRRSSSSRSGRPIWALICKAIRVWLALTILTHDEWYSVL